MVHGIQNQDREAEKEEGKGDVREKRDKDIAIDHQKDGMANSDGLE